MLQSKLLIQILFKNNARYLELQKCAILFYDSYIKMLRFSLPSSMKDHLFLCFLQSTLTHVDWSLEPKYFFLSLTVNSFAILDLQLRWNNLLASQNLPVLKKVMGKIEQTHLYISMHNVIFISNVLLEYHASHNNFMRIHWKKKHPLDSSVKW